MQKLDHLIKVLNNVYSLCKENRHVGNEIDVVATKSEILTFNVNIKDDKFVHCHAKKGKYSLKIIDTFRGKSRQNPFSLHRCPSTLEITKEYHHSSFSNVLKTYRTIQPDLRSKSSHHLQRSFHTLLSNNFSSHLVQQIASLRSEIQGLRKLFNNTEEPMKATGSSTVSFKIGNLTRWMVPSKMPIGNPLLSDEDLKLINGKIRASNFCKFYKYVRIYKEKNRKKINRKKAIAQ